jgi:hypothetical protein
LGVVGRGGCSGLVAQGIGVKLFIGPNQKIW